ncbi:MAG: disulfide bond formation protein B [Cypionkella sp.]
MTRTLLILLAAGGSAAALAGAFAFQYIGGLAPCHLCLWQRYPHAVAIVIGILALLIPKTILARLLPLAGAAAALTTAVIAAYHTGVERHWWEGPTTCTSGSVANISAKDLLAQIQASPVVKCDQVAWQMFTLSMASWNMIASLALVALWLMAYKKS